MAEVERHELEAWLDNAVVFCVSCVEGALHRVGLDALESLHWPCQLVAGLVCEVRDVILGVLDPGDN